MSSFRRNLIMGLKGSRLPLGYTELDFIKGNGGYIDTGVNPHANPRILLNVSGIPSSAIAEFLGKTTTSDDINSAFSLCTRFGGVGTYFYYGSKTAVTQWAYWTGRIIDISNRLVVDGVTRATSQSTYVYDENSSNIRLFSSCYQNPETFDDASRRGKFNLHSCQIYDDGILVRDYVPCINLNNEVGLYDTVHDSFYGSKVSNYPFIAGNQN